MAKLFNVNVTFIDEVLGTSTKNIAAYSEYIAANSEDIDKKKEEVNVMEKTLDLLNEEEEGDDEKEKLSPTIFPRNEEGIPCFWDYQWRGYFKDAIGGLRKIAGTESKSVTAYKKVVDQSIFVFNRLIPINTNGDISICVRPLRASTAQGERIALAVSEAIPAGSTCSFEVLCLNNDHEKLVLEALQYGVMKGTGQWRNAGKGRFLCEVSDVKTLTYTEAQEKIYFAELERAKNLGFVTKVNESEKPATRRKKSAGDK